MVAYINTCQLLTITVYIFIVLLFVFKDFNKFASWKNNITVIT
jgi:hypothetical protein